MLLAVFIGQLLVAHYSTVFAQASSPYSRYGLGFVRSNVFSANKGMGDISAPYFSGLHINAANPASYASLMRTTIEMGANFDGVNIKAANDSVYKTGNGSVSHLAVAFVPKPDRWAISAGLLPYTNINYNFVQSVNDSTVASYNDIYAGSGSLYQVYAGGAYKFKNRINEQQDQFSIGANFGYIFGKLRYQKIITFPDSTDTYTSNFVSDLYANSFNYNIGIQYTRKIYHNESNPDERTDIYLTIGATANGGLKLNTRINDYWTRLNYLSTGISIIDTPSAQFNKKGKLNMPANFTGGVMVGNERFWMLGMDFKYSTWSNFQSPLYSGKLQDSWRLALGFQVTPSYLDRKYYNRIQFRLGAYYGKSEVVYNNQQLNDVAGTFGLGFPFKLFKFTSTMFNVSGQVGSRGNNEPSAFKETYYRFTFGLVLNDADWFRKRRYD